jgi:putative molybdopterin biosynthesis protein
MNGLKILKSGSAMMSCVHILDIEKKEYNLSYIDRYLNKDDFVVIHLFLREQGIYLPKNNPNGIHLIEDIANKGVTFLNRSQGTGTRLLIDFLLHEKNIDPLAIKGYNTEVESHLQAGLKVLKGEVEAAFGIRHVAHLLDLDFIPQYKERFDLVIAKEYFHSSQVKTFLTFFEQPALLHHVKDFTGYDTTKIGNIIHPETRS